MSKSDQAFQKDIEYRMYRLRHFAQKYGWADVSISPDKIVRGLASDNKKEFEFKNSEGAILKINYFDMKIETTLTHPKWGSTVLIRKGNLTQKIIESIFRNPRKHMPEQVKSEYKNLIEYREK